MARERTDRLAELGAFIREQRENARLSVRRLSELAEVSNPYLSQIERGLRRPSAEILQQIAKGLKISAESLYVRAGILDPERREDVEDAILRDPRLTRSQKDAMLGVYRSFVGPPGESTAAEPAGSPAEEDADVTVTEPAPPGGARQPRR